MSVTNQSRASITVRSLQKRKQDGEKFSCLTAYDACFAEQVSDAGIDVILVGDSLGMVLQGHDSTLPVSVDDMAYHTASVARCRPHSLIMADFPFMAAATETHALEAAYKLMQAGANMVKLEGDRWLEGTIALLKQNGVPVCAHLGLTPQSVNAFGGYRVQGREADAAQKLVESALALEQAGADVVLLECVPRQVAADITQQLQIPVIGIGAGPDCDGQVLVLHDLLGITPGKPARFVKNFLQENNSIQEALKAYDQAVKSGHFPAPENWFES